MRRAWVISALLLVAHAASAAPHGAKAKADFDRGVKAYQKGEYAAASEAFKKSFAAESDIETLFAWAQAERQQDHCEAAIELYHQLEDFPLPAKNREVIVAKRRECQAIVDAQHPPEPPPKPRPPKPVDEPTPEPPPEPAVEPPPEPAHPRHARRAHAEHEAWYSDATGDALVGIGAVTLATGIGFLLEGNSADTERAQATRQSLFDEERDRANRDGKIGTACLAGGALLVAGGIVRFTIGHGPETPVVSGWATPTSGGLAVLGRF